MKYSILKRSIFFYSQSATRLALVETSTTYNTFQNPPSVFFIIFIICRSVSTGGGHIAAGGCIEGE